MCRSYVECRLASTTATVADLAPLPFPELLATTPGHSMLLQPPLIPLLLELLKLLLQVLLLLLLILLLLVLLMLLLILLLLE